MQCNEGEREKLHVLVREETEKMIEKQRVKETKYGGALAGGDKDMLNKNNNSSVGGASSTLKLLVKDDGTPVDEDDLSIEQKNEAMKVNDVIDYYTNKKLATVPPPRANRRKVASQRCITLSSVVSMRYAKILFSRSCSVRWGSSLARWARWART